MNNTLLESIRVTKFDGKKTFGLNQIHHNIFFQNELSKEEKFLVSLIKSLYGDFNYIDDKKNLCSTTRLISYESLENLFNFKYSEIEVKTTNYKRLSIKHFSDNSLWVDFYNHELSYSSFEVRHGNAKQYKRLDKELDKFLDHGRLLFIPQNRCYPEPKKAETEYKLLRELVKNADSVYGRDFVAIVDDTLYRLENTPLDDLLGRYISGRNIVGFNHHQLKEAFRNIFGSVNVVIKRYFHNFGIDVELRTSARLDSKDGDEKYFNTPWYDIYKDGEKVTFYDLTLEERNILYIVAAIFTYRDCCAYFIMEEMYLDLMPAMKTNIEQLISKFARNTIHVLTTNSSHIYYEKNKEK